jgi:Flp pilus assembly protein TadD
MSIRMIQVLVAVAACLPALCGCASGTKISGPWLSQNKSSQAPKQAGKPLDDVQLGDKYYRAKNYMLAAQSYTSAAQAHPDNAKAWLGLATAYDQMHQFKLADEAYQHAIGITGETVEILNDEGYSYILRGDYQRARHLLEEAEVKDPANPYVQTNMHLLDKNYFGGKVKQ